MPFALFCVLEALLKLGRSAGNIYALELEAGFTIRSMQTYYLPLLTRLGWITSHWGRWEVTERGRIVLALEKGMQTRERSLGCRITRPSLKKLKDRLNENLLTAGS